MGTDIINEIQLQRKIFLSRFGIEPDTVTIGIEDFKALENEIMFMTGKSLRDGHDLKVYGLKILRSPDLNSGTLRLSPSEY